MTRARGTLKRRTRRIAGNTIRRLGILPASMPDRLGDDDRLAAASLPHTVIVYFPDTRETLYQLRQWYGPLEALDARHPVVVVLQDSRTAKLVRSESRLSAITVARYSRLDDLLSRSNVKLALYVNHNPQNFACLRFISLAHVHLSHGESDKGVSVSNQVKAYDFNFVAGQAAIDRTARYLMLYDAQMRSIPIGRPQLDQQPAIATPPDPRNGPSKPTVLYCPTWEGAQPSMAYSSGASHGPAIVRELLDSGRFRLVYRPHPLAGVTDELIGTADATMRKMIANAAAASPEAGHQVDTDCPLSESMQRADLMICDVSGVAVDWLPSGKPLIITEPVSTQTVVASTRLLDAVPRLSLTDMPNLIEMVSDQTEQDPQRQQRLELIEYYMGDTAPGSATERFIAACERVMAIRDREWAHIIAAGPAGP